MNIKMERPNLNEDSNDLLDQVEYLIELEKYCDFIETENKRLKLCEVMQQSGQLKEKYTPEFNEWLKYNSYKQGGKLRYKKGSLFGKVIKLDELSKNYKQYL